MERDAAIVRAVEAWFGANGRVLPWREESSAGVRDAYRSLVSEFMLQQTQVSRVLEHFEPFLERFPTVEALAQAREDDVRAVWSGLGYYSRARRLHEAAKEIVARFGGVVPREAVVLRTLPGVGRYTAGAVASIVFGGREAIVDGNVSRVLQRVDGVAREGKEDWARAGELVAVARRPGVFNEGLMELGATVCVPRGPRCGECPLRELCVSRAQGTTSQIPIARVRAERRPLYWAAVVGVDGRGRVMLEQRPAKGLFASMWQVPTVEREDRMPRAAEVRGLVPCRAIEAAGRVSHQTTHRAIEVRVYRAVGLRATEGRRWVAASERAELAMGNVQSRIVLIGMGRAGAVQC